MPLPHANPNPPFNITRASHVVLSSRDLDATRNFYENVLGFIVSEQTDTHLYLRGIEERGHHSVVFERQDGPRRCLRMGYRMFTDDDIQVAYEHFHGLGMDAKLVDRPHQGPTLHLTDPVGIPVEFCATMTQVQDQLQNFPVHKGGRPQVFDHWQIYSHNVPAAMDFYMGLGFRMTEYIGAENDSAPPAIWLQRKGATQDVVFNTAPGPQVHHFAFSAPGIADLIQAADMAAASGMPQAVERGPGRHGISNALFMYFRDPDGHRIELFTDHYMAIDSDHEVKRWAPEDPSKAQIWGMPATERYYREVTPFAGTELTNPKAAPGLLTLEKFLQEDAKQPFD